MHKARMVSFSALFSVQVSCHVTETDQEISFTKGPSDFDRKCYTFSLEPLPNFGGCGHTSKIHLSLRYGLSVAEISKKVWKQDNKSEVNT